MIEIKITNLEEMATLAAKIASIATPGDVIGLKGNLGVGKTFFAGAFINSLLEKPQIITSPTFNLVYSYHTKKGEIYHFDLYRLKSSEELYNIGIEDAINSGISLIEWPMIAKNFCVRNFLEVEIIMGDDSYRLVILKPDQYWIKKLEKYEISNLA